MHTHRFEPVLQGKLLSVVVLEQPLANLGDARPGPGPLGHGGLLLLDVEEGDGAALEQREVEQLPPALLHEHGAVGELAPRAEALVHLLQPERRRLVLGAVRGRRRLGEPRPGGDLPLPVPAGQGQRPRRGGIGGPDGDLGLHLQQRGLRALEAERPLDAQLSGAQRRPEDGRRRLPRARGGGRRRRRRFLLHVQRVVVVGGAREEHSHGDDDGGDLVRSDCRRPRATTD